MTRESAFRLLIGAGAAGALTAYLGFQWMLGPLEPATDFSRPPATTIIEIPEGMTLRQLATRLGHWLRRQAEAATLREYLAGLVRRTQSETLLSLLLAEMADGGNAGTSRSVFGFLTKGVSA